MYPPLVAMIGSSRVSLVQLWNIEDLVEVPAACRTLGIFVNIDHGLNNGEVYLMEAVDVRFPTWRKTAS